MSEQKRRLRDIDVTEFDRMSIDELEEIIRQEEAFSEMNENCINDIIHILGIVADREREAHPEKYPDIEEAKRSFDLNYRPIAEAGEELLDYEEFSEPEAKIRSVNPRRKTIRTIVAIAAVIALLVAGSVVASAMGFNVWRHIANWTDDAFSFTERHDGNEVLTEFEESLRKNGLDSKNLPRYIPDGYEIVSVDEFQCPEFEAYHCDLSDGTDYITIEYFLALGDVQREYEKNEKEPEIKTINGIDYYFVYNDGFDYVVWMDGNLECCITYTDFGLDAERIIRSIPGGK